MPNLSRLADRAIVYNNHYSGGNFTTPGTASLLTGTLPWTNRATQHNGKVAKDFLQKNIFHLFQNYHRIAYSHNLLANTLLKQFSADIDYYLQRDELLLDKGTFIYSLFKNDEDIVSVSWLRAIQQEEGFSYSLFSPRLYSYFNNRRDEKLKDILAEYPLGIPYTLKDDYYVLEQAIDYLQSLLLETHQPFLGYFHFFPPHAPYHTRKEFIDQFLDDGFLSIDKPNHTFTLGYSHRKLNLIRATYDEFILYADYEFSRLYDYLEQTGLLDDTWIVLTSDHGELFERGTAGHTTPVLHQPVIRVPLMIFEPGRKSRVDIYDKTSSIDILPTLLKISGQEIPTWAEGKTLLPYATSNSSSSRDIFAIETRDTGENEPISKASVMLVRENFKLIYYFGYDELASTGELVELYNIENDPEELNNLYNSRRNLADDMLAVIKQKLQEVNQPYAS